MSLSHFKPPFRACPHGRIIDSQETPLCKEIEVIEASEICAILNAHFQPKEEPKPEAPQPNREETDRVAAEYYKSGRTLEVQASIQGTWSDQTSPSFSYNFPWRIKPKKRRVVVKIYESPTGNLSALVSRDDFTAPTSYRHVGTAECEVEA